MINEGDVLYAARDITFHHIYGTGDQKVMFRKGAVGKVIGDTDYGLEKDDDFAGLRIAVGFGNQNVVEGYEWLAFDYEDLSLFTRMKPE